jgi:hypothetical protein
MNLIVKSTWTVLILGAAVGCAGDTETEAPAPPVTNNPPVIAPPPRIANKPDSDGAKDTAQKVTPAPAPSPGAKTSDKISDGDAPKVEGPKADNTKAGADKLTAEELDAIKELPAAEQDAALAQLTCPVSSDHLGSMGKPFKVTAEGRTFYLCCDGCQKDLKANPKAVIAKLDAKKSGK